MSDLVIFCKACQMAHQPVGFFPTTCPNPDCQLSPARWTTTRPYPSPRTNYRPSVDDRTFLATLKIDGAD